MTVVDALLLDPHPFSEWIAHRADDISNSGTAIDQSDGVENALVEGNVADLPPLPEPNATPFFYNDGKSIRYFNNQDPAGKLIQGTQGYNGPKVDELATRIEDALALCL